MGIKEDLVNFVVANGLSPFNRGKTYLQASAKPDSIFKTRDAKSMFNKTLSVLSQEFVFADSSNLFHAFDFSQDVEVIQARQEFFRTACSLEGNNDFLKSLSKPRAKWQPPYEIIVVTEDEQTFVKLNELGCIAQLLVSESDVMELEKYDIVQVIDCEDFSRVLERLPQAVFIDSIENAYLERYLEELSGWKENIDLINQGAVSLDLKNVIGELENVLGLLQPKKLNIASQEEVEKILESINEVVSDRIKDLMISGESLVKMLGESQLPEQMQKVVEEEIAKTGLPQHVFNFKIPVEIDYRELDDTIKKQSANEFTNLAEEIKGHAEDLKAIPAKLERLSALVLIEDFIFGLKDYISSAVGFPEFSFEEEFKLVDTGNIFLENADKISFVLDSESRCSILTGANSGGKTTLLENVLQKIGLARLGLPVSGEIKMPLFSDVYYFAKNKGSASKGAFETLLTQMSRIKLGKGSAGETLILADEIEAVTEPGVAGEIISATAEYFLDRRCFLIIATHLGHEIQKSLPKGCRIDGIEAKGLDENFELIVEHNPVLGRLAHSTPELIVEKMANTLQEDYFRHIDEFLKGRKDTNQ